jgi:hypothetical protein
MLTTGAGTAPRQAACGLLFLVMAFLGLGCGKGVGDVKGRVTYQNKPLPDGTVKIRGSDGIPRDGEIQPNGEYVVKGVPVGPAQVLVSSFDPKSAEPSKEKAGKDKGSKLVGRVRPVTGDPQDKSSRIPLHYGIFDTSGLSLEVKRGENEYPIDLK